MDLTKPLLETLSQTNVKLQNLAKENIEKAQKKMIEQYANRNASVKPHNFKKDDKVQYRNTRNDKRKGGKLDPKWYPLKGHLNIKTIQNNICELRRPRGKSRYPDFNIHTDNLRHFVTPLPKKRKREHAEKDETPKKKTIMTGTGDPEGRPQRKSTAFDFSKL